MADYTSITNAAVGVGGLPSGTTVTALRDNPIAIAEGAAGAPRIEDAALSSTVTAAGETWVSDRLNAGTENAALSAGSVGTYVFAESSSGTTRALGVTISGGSLTPASMSSPNGTGTNVTKYKSGSVSGTWRCMGYSFQDSLRGSTLWLRIS